MAIKMIGLDLDGTTLNENGEFSERTIDAFKKANDRGIHIVIATGRTLRSLPKEIYGMQGLDYVVTSNGARIIKTQDKSTLCVNYIAGDAVRTIHDFLKSKDAMIEIFFDGRAYISSAEYERIIHGGTTLRDRKYVSETRTPVEDIFKMLYENADAIENISVNYPSDEEKTEMEKELALIPNITLTSSFRYNNEIGGINTSKAEGLKFLMKKLNISQEELMCCGDSPNDISMLKLAGTGVAVENAKEEVKAASDYVTDHHARDGVAKAIERFALI